MKVIMRTCDIARLGNEGTWEFLRSKGMDIDKPVYALGPCKTAKTIYAFAYEGEKKLNE